MIYDGFGNKYVDANNVLDMMLSKSERIKNCVLSYKKPTPIKVSRSVKLSGKNLIKLNKSTISGIIIDDNTVIIKAGTFSSYTIFDGYEVINDALENIGYLVIESDSDAPFVMRTYNSQGVAQNSFQITEGVEIQKIVIPSGGMLVKFSIPNGTVVPKDIHLNISIVRPEHIDGYVFEPYSEAILKTGYNIVPQGEFVLHSEIEFDFNRIVGADETLQSSEMNNVLYFSVSGDDANDGVTPATPKKDPTSYTLEGNHAIMLKSGDVFNIRTMVVGNNTEIRSYGGNLRPVLNGVFESDEVFVKIAENTYQMTIHNVNDIGFLVIDGEYKYKRTITKATVDSEGEFIFDETTGLLTYYTASNMEGKKVSYTSGLGGIVVNGSNIVIDGIEIYGYGAGIIGEQANTENVLITNNYIHHIGGTHFTLGGRNTKAGNGIHFWSNGHKNITVKHNVVEVCYDTGISFQNNDSRDLGDNENLSVVGNLVTKCYWGIEYFNTNGYHNFVNLVTKNNVVLDSCDITDGYREGAWSGICCGLYISALLEDDELIIEDNIIMKSEDYSVVIGNKAQGTNLDYPQYKWNNNIVIASRGNTWDTTVNWSKFNGGVCPPFYSGAGTPIHLPDKPNTTDEYIMYNYYTNIVNQKVADICMMRS